MRTFEGALRRRAPRLELGLAAVALAALLAWAWVVVPVATGARTFFLRDVFTTHLPLKAFGAAELKAGRIPAFNPTWGLGQPFRGNPNALPFYPGNLLYLGLPFWSAFNLHYSLHWLLAGLAMAALARALGQGWPGSLLAALCYAGSGWMLSALTFYNLLAVAAWWPLVLAGAVRGGRRGIAWGSIACGLALLGGEPVAAALGLVPLLLAALRAHGPRRGVATAGAIVVLGALVALPQIVATLRVLPFTVRGGYGLSAQQAAEFSLHPLRLLELVVPFPFGRPATIGPQGVWAIAVMPEMPLFLTLYPGIVALWLAARTVRRQQAWAALAILGLGLAIVAGGWGDVLVRLSFGLFRFPEKFLFWFALALPLLAGWGVDDLVDERHALPAAKSRPGHWAMVSGAALLAAGILMALGRSGLVAAAAGRLAGLGIEQRSTAIAIVAMQLRAWEIALLIAGAALVAAVFAARSRSGALLAALELATLCQLYPLLATDSTAPYRQPPPWESRFAAGPAPLPSIAALHELMVFPRWMREPAYRLPAGSRAVLEQMKAHDLAPAPGVLHGLTYPLAPDLEGMQSPFATILHQSLAKLPWQGRARWLEVMGVQAAVLFENPGPSAVLRPLETQERWGVPSRLYQISPSSPAAWWPSRLVTAPSPAAAVEAVSGFEDPIGTVAVPRPVPHDPFGTMRLLAETPDRLELEVRGGGGVAVVRRAYEPLYRATAGGHPLTTFPVDLDLLGVVVPPGRQRVTVAVSSRPEILAAAVAGITLLGLIAGGLKRRLGVRSPAERHLADEG